jgi:hypothetical protein
MPSGEPVGTDHFVTLGLDVGSGEGVRLGMRISLESEALLVRKADGIGPGTGIPLEPEALLVRKADGIEISRESCWEPRNTFHLGTEAEGSMRIDREPQEETTN